MKKMNISRALRISSLGLFSLVAITSCGVYQSTNYSEYRGDSITRGTGGTVKQVGGIDVWTTGTPNRQFKILGLVDQSYTNDNSAVSVLAGMGRSAKIAKLAKSKGGDAIIYMDNSTKLTGYSRDGMAFGHAYGGYGSTHAHVQSFSNTRANTHSNSKVAVIKYLE